MLRDQRPAVSVDLEQLHDQCRAFEYQLWLRVDPHFYLLASPGDSARLADCPYLAAHVNLVDNNDLANADSQSLEKQMIVWSKHETNETPFSREAHPIGQYTLIEFLDAYQQAHTGDDNGIYSDVVKLNCADFIVSMGALLHVKINKEIKAYVAQGIMSENSQGLVDNIRQSDHYSSLVETIGKVKVTDNDLVEALMATRTSKIEP